MKHPETIIVLPDLRLGDRLPQSLKRKLEGPHPWGYQDVSSQGRGLWVRERLTVFPPGTTASDRRAIALFRNWPVIGSIAALAAMIGLGLFFAPLTAFFLAFALYAASVWVGARATRRVREASVQLMVVRATIDGGVSCWGNLASMASARAALERLDSRAVEERLTPAQYEARWAHIFHSLDEGREALAEELERAAAAVDRGQCN